MSLWSLATPLFGGPDEPVHVIKAVAEVRGQLVGDLVGGPKSPFGRVSVPEFYATTRSVPACFHGRPTVPASCAPIPYGSSSPTDVLIYVARYPPLYYAIVGLPSLLGSSSTELYLMRLVSAALSAFFIALAVASCLRWSGSPIALAGILVAATPTVVFLGGVVNPTGLEISAAICLWTSASLLVVGHLAEPPPGLLVVIGTSAAVFELVRGLSPFWLALSALTLVGVADLRGLRQLLARRSAQLTGATVLGAGALAVAWILREHSLDVYSNSAVPAAIPGSQILETAFGRTTAFVHEMIGVFGWVDTDAPSFTYLAWYALVGATVLSAAVLVRLRQALVLAALAVAIVAVPVMISVSQVHTDGFTWSGRDTLPFAVGLPVLAAVLLASHRRAPTLLRLVSGVAAAATTAAYFESLRRNAVGTAGPDFGFLLHSPFDPPLGNAGLLVAEIAVALLGVVLVSLVARPADA